MAEKGENFLKQFRDETTMQLRKVTASQFIDVWSHYDADGNFFFLNIFLIK